MFFFLRNWLLQVQDRRFNPSAEFNKGKTYSSRIPLNNIFYYLSGI